MTDSEIQPASIDVMGIAIDVGSLEEILDRILTKAKTRTPAFVCQCNVHSLVTAQDNPEFHKALDSAFIRAADGAPVSWALRRAGAVSQERVGGPDLMWKLCEKMAGTPESVFFYGGKAETLKSLLVTISRNFPLLQIAGSNSPPFRPLSTAEEEANIREISESGANVVFVGLGCPKQEIWMAKVSPKIPAVMIGVGAAFDFFSGEVKRAPEWVQRFGFEWFHRFLQEPGRLWRRYLTTNFRYVWHQLTKRSSK